jgi:hypothetical protein
VKVTWKMLRIVASILFVLSAILVFAFTRSGALMVISCITGLLVFLSLPRLNGRLFERDTDRLRPRRGSRAAEGDSDS